MPDPPLASALQYETGTSAGSDAASPAAGQANGSARSRPPTSTHTCTAFTLAEDSRPPVAKYTVATTPPMTQPQARGTPATVCSRPPSAINCAARMASDPNQSSAAISARTSGPKRALRKSPSVRWSSDAAIRQMRGPTTSARTMEPRPAEPTHHHAARPSRYPRPAAPTVDPAPMLAAIRVPASRAGDNRRPATKKSEAVAVRDDHHPRAISAAA